MTFFIDSQPAQAINWWLFGGGIATVVLLMIIMAVVLRLKPSLGEFSTDGKARGAELVVFTILLGIFCASAYKSAYKIEMGTAQQAAVISAMEEELGLKSISSDDARALNCLEGNEGKRTYVDAANENGEPVTGTLHRSAVKDGTCEYRFAEES